MSRYMRLSGVNCGGKPIVHIIGAGLAGLVAAVRLAGGSRVIVVHKAAVSAVLTSIPHSA